MFNSNINKVVKEIILSRELVNPLHPQVKFNKAPVAGSNSPKHFSLHLDEK